VPFPFPPAKPSSNSLSTPAANRGEQWEKIRIDSRRGEEQDRQKFVSVRILVLGVFLGAGGLLQSAGTDVLGFQKQLAAAQEETDKPAIIELSRRIVEADPQDSTTWETLARTQFEVAEYNRCTATLNAWANEVKPTPAVLDDLRGDVAEAR